jgi:hypothetical protein
MSLKAVEKLISHPCLSTEGFNALLIRYVDLNRQNRILNVAQWETARALALGWHGTPAELIETAKELK